MSVPDPDREPREPARGPAGSEAAFEAAAVPLATLGVPQHAFLACNAAFRGLYGGRDDFLGRTPAQLWPDGRGARLSALVDGLVAAAALAAPTTAGGSSFVDPTSQLPVDLVGDALAEGLLATPRRDAAGRVVAVDLLVPTLGHVQSPGPVQELTGARSVIDRLQAELLPEGTPVLPTLDVAAAYLLADDEIDAGGDWFDCVTRPDGTVAVAVGDVAGHGVTAATTMGQLRAVLHERLAAGAQPAEAAAALAAFARGHARARATTLCVMVLDPTDGTLEYCTAGHPPPLLVGAEVAFLPSTGSPALGLEGTYASLTARMELDDHLLLYTDGLVERSVGGVAAGSVELLEAVRQAREAHCGPEDDVRQLGTDLVEGMQQRLDATVGSNDDVTVVALKRIEEVPPLFWRAEAVTGAGATAREAVRTWLVDLGIDEGDVVVVQHAVGELVDNVVTHAYGDDLGPRPVELTARLTPDGHLVTIVGDSGRWRPPADGRRGHGLAMVRLLCDRFRVDAGASGTEVELAHRLRRHVPLVSRRSPATARERQPLSTGFSVQVEGDRAAVVGAVDAETADRMLVELLRASLGATVPLRVDLSGVTHLASPGVAALGELLDGVRTPGPRVVELVAAPGSVAQQVLETLRLAYSTS